MVFVHDEVADRKVGVALYALAVLEGFFLFGLAEAGALDDLVVRQHGELCVRQLVARGQRADGDGTASGRRQAAQLLVERDLDALADEGLGQQLRAALVGGEDHDGIFLAYVVPDVVDRGLGAAAVGRELLRQRVDDALRLDRIAAGGEVVAHDEGEVPEPRARHLPREKVAGGLSVDHPALDEDLEIGGVLLEEGRRVL